MLGFIGQLGARARHIKRIYAMAIQRDIGSHPGTTLD
jgi:hypothetical protein